MASDIQVQRMIDLGVPEAKAASTAAAASSATSGEAFNAIVKQSGGKVTESPAYPAEGTPAGADKSIDNGDGTFTIIHTVADGKGGTRTYPTTSGTKRTGATGPAITGATGSSTDSQLAGLQKQLADLQTSTAAQTATAQATAAQTQQNAIQFLTSTFQSYGLSADLAAGVTNLVQQGYTSDTIQLISQDPNSKDPLAVAFQQRFPANAARLKAGLPVLSPGQYIATERSYAQVMQSYGLTSDFATNKDVFTKLLTADVSPTELNTRVSTAKQVVDNTDPLVTQQLQQYYGLTQADMIAHVLDPSVATPIIEKQISAAQIGAQSARYGINVGQGQAEQLSGLGVTQAQATAGFQNIASQLPGTQALASRYGAYGPAGDVGQALQAATFGTTGSINAQAELERLRMQEISQFSGSSGVGKGSISQLEEGAS
jgi:hypothetical protein